jgi:hypothetical protein
MAPGKSNRTPDNNEICLIIQAEYPDVVRQPMPLRREVDDPLAVRFGLTIEEYS